MTDDDILKFRATFEAIAATLEDVRRRKSAKDKAPEKVREAWEGASVIESEAVGKR